MDFLTTMVNTLPKPLFDLEVIRAAVKAGSWAMTRTARQNAEDLGHDSDSVRSILLELTSKDFRYVWNCRDENSRTPKLDARGVPIRMDVYSPKVTVPNGELCHIYLKISLNERGAVIVTVSSFHLCRK